MQQICIACICSLRGGAVTGEDAYERLRRRHRDAVATSHVRNGSTFLQRHGIAVDRGRGKLPKKTDLPPPDNTEGFKVRCCAVNQVPKYLCKIVVLSTCPRYCAPQMHGCRACRQNTRTQKLPTNRFRPSLASIVGLCREQRLAEWESSPPQPRHCLNNHNSRHHSQHPQRSKTFDVVENTTTPASTPPYPQTPATAPAPSPTNPCPDTSSQSPPKSRPRSLAPASCYPDRAA